MKALNQPNLSHGLSGHRFNGRAPAALRNRACSAPGGTVSTPSRRCMPCVSLTHTKLSSGLPAARPLPAFAPCAISALLPRPAFSSAPLACPVGHAYSITANTTATGTNNADRAERGDRISADTAVFMQQALLHGLAGAYQGVQMRCACTVQRLVTNGQDREGPGGEVEQPGLPSPALSRLRFL